ncbi:hypothetical protein QI554_13495 [Yinghuangia seranimata]|nr:DUF6879 family protein [Yinghuangia seranimata]MDI2127164.1 hypothetical protein [Yinghuangia seranimata]
MPNVRTWDELFEGCQFEAVHLELRDLYNVDDEYFADWRAGRLTAETHSGRWSDFCSTVAAATGRGVQVRRLRVVSLPASDYIRYEHAGTPATIRSGEEVRWLDRGAAPDVQVPVNDLWVFDRSLVRWNIFDGDDRFLRFDDVENKELAARIVDSFDAAWKRGVPHEDFVI